MKNIILIAAAIFMLAVFGYFAPSYFASSDEQGYLTNAILLANGKPLVQEHNLYYCALTQPTPHGFFSSYPIGKSIALIPVIGHAFFLLFAVGILIHLLNYFLFIGVLKKLDLNPLWALIYLFFPAFQWSSRTLYPELLVLTCWFAALYLWLEPGKKRAFFAGVLMGLAVFVRTDAFIGIIAMAAHAYWNERERLMPFLVGAIIPLVRLAEFNLSTFGSFLPQVGSSTPILGINVGPERIIDLITIFGLLMVVLPFSLLSLTRKTVPKAFFWVLTILSALFFWRFFAFWAFEISIPLTFTARIRYFIPLIGMLMIPTIYMYSEWLAKARQKIPSEIFWKGAIVVLALLMVGGTVYLHSTHANFLDERKKVLDIIHEQIPVGSTVIGNADDCMYFFPDHFGETKYFKVNNWGDRRIEYWTFVIDISYSTQRDGGESIRQDVIDRERGVMKEFIAKNANVLDLHYQSTDGAWVTIWRGKQ